MRGSLDDKSIASLALAELVLTNSSDEAWDIFIEPEGDATTVQAKSSASVFVAYAADLLDTVDLEIVVHSDESVSLYVGSDQTYILVPPAVSQPEGGWSYRAYVREGYHVPSWMAEGRYDAFSHETGTDVMNCTIILESSKHKPIPVSFDDDAAHGYCQIEDGTDVEAHIIAHTKPFAEIIRSDAVSAIRVNGYRV